MQDRLMRFADSAGTSESTTAHEMYRLAATEITGLKTQIERMRERAAQVELELDAANRAHADMAARLAENGRALVQIRGFAKVMDEHNWRDLRLHIERQCKVIGRGDEQSPPPEAGFAIVPKDAVRQISELEAALLRLLKGEHCSLHLSFNDENAPNYMTVEQAFTEYRLDRDWVSEEEKRRAFETNRMWTLHWYPLTPIGFNSWSASSLPVLLDFVLSGKWKDDEEKPSYPAGGATVLPDD